MKNLLRYLLFTALLINGSYKAFSQSCANYTTARTTGITYNSVAATANVVPYWRNQVANQNDDNRSRPIPIGFDFWYLGVRYTSVNISINGFIDFSTTSYDGNWPLGNPNPQPPGYAICGSWISYRENGSTFYNSPCGNGTPPQSFDGTYMALAAMYCDIWCSNGVNALANSIKYETIGTAPNRVFIVEYIDMDDWITPSISSYNFQIKLYETTGVIEYVYGSMVAGPGAPTPYSCGINGVIQTTPPAPSELLTQQGDNSSVFSNTVPVLHTAVPESNSMLSFTPPPPANSLGSLTFSSIGNINMTLNWTDWATNELGYVIYMSTDGVNYSFYTQLPANSTSYAANNLYGTTYWWKVYAVTEGCLSSPISGSQATLPGGTFISVMSGDWSNGATWNAGTVPTTGDNVIIDNGHTVVIDGSYGCTYLTVGQGASGTLLIGNSTSSNTITILGDVRVRSGGVFAPNPAFAATHRMTVSGHIRNDGTINMRPNATSLCNITFNKNGNQTISGAGTINSYNKIAISMGSSINNTLEVTSTNFSAPSNFLTMNNGTFKFSVPSNAVTLDVFTSPTTIPHTCGLWMNSPNSIMYAHSTLNFQGDLTCSRGIVNIGDNADETLMSNGALLTISGGTVNVAGRLDRPSYIAVTNVSITGGTLNLNTIGSTSTTSAPFMIDVIGSTFNMTGGKIVIRKSGGANLGYYNINCSPYSFTGGTLQIGDASTPAAQTMQIYTDNSVANLTVNSTNSPTAQFTRNLTVTRHTTINATSTLNCNNFNLTMGGDMINNGTFISGNNLSTFNGSAAQEIRGTTALTEFNNLTINNSSGDVTINNNGSVNVNGTLGFNNGKFILGDNNLRITSGNAITGFNSNRYVVTNGNPIGGGYLQINNVTSSIDFPIGTSTSSYTPILNFVNSGSADDFNARVFPGVYLNGTTGAAITDGVVNKTWVINEATSGGSTIDMDIQWNTADEDVTFDRTICSATNYNNGLTKYNVPILYAAATANPSPFYFRSMAGVNSLTSFVVMSGSSPLPIELLSFNASLNQNKQADIIWKTANEVNNDYFTVERSRDKIQVEEIEKIDGAGTSNEMLNYKIIDKNPLKGISYYRLKQTDFNGQSTYTDFKAIELNEKTLDPQISVYPNPFSNKLNVSSSMYGEGVKFNVSNLLGRVISSEQLLTPSLQLLTSNLENGVYFVEVFNGIEKKVTRVVKAE